MPAVDTLAGYQPSSESSPNYAETVVPDNTTELTYVSTHIYVGGTGDVTLLTLTGQTVTFKAVPVGVTLKVRAKRVNLTGTTATLMVALTVKP